MEGLPVTAVGENAFSSASYLDELTLPEGIRDIGAGAFGYSGLKVEKQNGGLRVSVNVKNIGAVTGDEVAQLYIRRVSPSKTVHPLRRLIGFERLHSLAPGQSAEAVFTVNPCDLEIYMEDAGKKVIEPGKYLVYAGGSCLDERIAAEIEL